MNQENKAENKAEDKQSKILSDDDWKQQAQQEKEKLSHKEKKQPRQQTSAKQKSAPPSLPPANFITLLNSIVMQIFYCLGKFADPAHPDADAHISLELAKHHIDMLAVLEEKTKGNLSDEESRALALALHEVRMQYVQAASV